MANGQTHIVVVLDTKEPIEIGDFVGAFTSIANQYNKFMSENYPELGGESRIFVKEVRSGSIIADLIPIIQTVIGLPEATEILMRQSDAIIDFVSKYGEKIKTYFSPGKRVESASPSDLKDLMGSVIAIANDPDGKSSIQAVYYEDGKNEIRAAVTFSSREARNVQNNILAHRAYVEGKSHVPHTRVLMTFVQSNIKDIPKDKKSGERVVIEELSKLERPIFYASDMAEKKIKHEIRDADENVYKKGFIVDVFVETKNDKIVAYKITELHEVIDLPDD